MEIIRYKKPDNWIKYDASKVALNLVEAAVSLKTLISIPYKLEWVEELQEMQLKREVAGTSKIEGAEFTEKEFEEAIKESPGELRTRSQRQANSAMKAYRWITTLDENIEVDRELVLEIHSKMIVGADDDRSAPGALRKNDQNVSFGSPRHRGAEGGIECKEAFSGLVESIGNEFKSHHAIIQALAAHYHLGAMHPFQDGNGRTARALEALLLRRLGLKSVTFIAMSNYYYDEKTEYLEVLSEVRQNNFDLTSFLNFALKGIIIQSERMLDIIKENNKILLFKDTMNELFGLLKTSKRRVIRERQIAILELLLVSDNYTLSSTPLFDVILDNYSDLKNRVKAMGRDIVELFKLGAIKINVDDINNPHYKINLDWPTEITETEFYKRIKTLPREKSHSIHR